MTFHGPSDRPGKTAQNLIEKKSNKRLCLIDQAHTYLNCMEVLIYY